METFWRTSAVGAELIQVASPAEPKDEKILGAVEIAHGYCFPWAKNTHGNTIRLVCRFDEYIEKSKDDVVAYLIEKGILPENFNFSENEKAD